MPVMEQLNVRIDADLKARGTAALASIGLTPSQAVRLLWARAAERGEGLEKVKALAEKDDRQGDGSVSGFEEGRRQIDEALKRMGLYGLNLPELTDEELMELSYQERGLL